MSDGDDDDDDDGMTCLFSLLYFFAGVLFWLNDGNEVMIWL
jgi:hypothetical protein